MVAYNTDIEVRLGSMLEVGLGYGYGSAVVRVTRNRNYGQYHLSAKSDNLKVVVM